MSRVQIAVAVTAMTGMLVAAGFGDSTIYSGPATRAAAQADSRAHITAPTKAQTAIGKPVTRFEFRLTRNNGEVAVYRTHTAAVKALAQAEALAKLFGQSFKGLAAVYGNAIVGFDKRPTTGERTEAQGWLRTR
jgi:hypothetical protein